MKGRFFHLRLSIRLLRESEAAGGCPDLSVRESRRREDLRCPDTQVWSVNLLRSLSRVTGAQVQAAGTPSHTQVAPQNPGLPRRGGYRECRIPRSVTSIRPDPDFLARPQRSFVKGIYTLRTTPQNRSTAGYALPCGHALGSAVCGGGAVKLN